MKVGLTMGKFLPFHKGHELLIQTALNCVDHLIVLIGFRDGDAISAMTRYKWVKECTRESNKVEIVLQKELDLDQPKDKDGTITNEEYWSAWLADTKGILEFVHRPKITHVFTSDKYGERVAKELNAVWYPVDPNREIIPISATKIRNDFLSYFNMLPPYVQYDLTATVAIVGPESTGKSRLVQYLASNYITSIPEYGRTICHRIHPNKISIEDFHVILKGQEALISNAKARGRPVVITDTDALVTAEYYKLYYPDNSSKLIDNFWKSSHSIDLYLVMAPSVPFVQDGERTMTEFQRWEFFYGLIERLRKGGKNYKVISSSQYHIRQAEAKKYIDASIRVLY